MNVCWKLFSSSCHSHVRWRTFPTGRETVHVQDDHVICKTPHWSILISHPVETKILTETWSLCFMLCYTQEIDPSWCQWNGVGSTVTSSAWIFFFLVKFFSQPPTHIFLSKHGECCLCCCCSHYLVSSPFSLTKQENKRCWKTHWRGVKINHDRFIILRKTMFCTYKNSRSSVIVL